jgi:site-specific DNA recombinase
MEKLRYAVYMRKSTEEEERQVLSLASQHDKIKERYSDLKIIAEFTESKSAFEPDKRPKFKELLELIDSGKIDGVIAWHPDRLSRNEVDASAITWRIRQGKIKDLRFASGFSFDNSPESMMMLQMTMSQSQYFSAKLSKDIKRGNERKRQDGQLTGKAMEGYLNYRTALSGRGEASIIKDDERFPLIRKAFDMFLTGEYSVPAILTIMNEEWGYRTTATVPLPLKGSEDNSGAAKSICTHIITAPVSGKAVRKKVSILRKMTCGRGCLNCLTVTNWCRSCMTGRWTLSVSLPNKR